jgi:hypothetical protein
LLALMLNLRKGTLLDELQQFTQALHANDGTAIVSPAALCKARQKLKAEAFVEVGYAALAAFAAHFALRRWHGLRLLAVDGSTGVLPEEPPIREYFGGPVDASFPMARLSRWYDVLNRVVVRADVAPYSEDERTLASPYLYEAGPDDLFLYDRGYPAFWLFAQHRDMQRPFCARAKLDFCREVSAFVASGARSALVSLHPSAHARRQCEAYNLSSDPVPVRLVRIDLDGGGTEVLITSLMDEQAFPTPWFSALYHLRWGVEEHYKREKSRMEIENFSGKSVLSVHQDIQAKVLAMNLTAMFAWIAQAVADRLYAERRHRYAINFANALTQMKNRIVLWLVGVDPSGALQAIITQMARAVEAVRPGRSSPRHTQRSTSKRFHSNYKRTR